MALTAIKRGKAHGVREHWIFDSCQFLPLDGIMNKQKKEKLLHFTTDGSTKVKKKKWEIQQLE